MPKNAWLGWAAVALLVVGGAGELCAVDPSPLQDAYWRFEEGVAGEIVPSGSNTVLDSINFNDMQRWAGDPDPTDATAPTYTTDVPAPVIPLTGQPNLLALDFVPFPDWSGGQDIYTDTKSIDNPIVDEITIEASFKYRYVGSIAGLDPVQGIVCREGWDKIPTTHEPAYVLRVRDTGHLQVQLVDGAGVVHEFTTDWVVQTGRWYHAATVNDGSTCKLYVDKNDGKGFVLQGTIEGLQGAMWQGGEGVDDFWANWCIGRADYGGSPTSGANPTDWSDATIDEVRISARALEPSEFLFFVPESPLRAVGIRRMAGDIVRVLFQDAGSESSAYGLAVSDTPSGPFTGDPAAVITDLGDGLIQADVPESGGAEQFYKGSATP